jgi:excisionase family DNA binding protein
MAGELYSIEQARAVLGGIARNTVYDLLRSGALASVPIGRRRFIASEAIAAFVAATSTTSGPLRGGISSAPPRR